MRISPFLKNTPVRSPQDVDFLAVLRRPNYTGNYISDYINTRSIQSLPFRRVYLLFDEDFLNLFPSILIDYLTVPFFVVAQEPFVSIQRIRLKN